MTTREKIIVGLMCLAIAYGAYDLISRGSTRPAKTNLTTRSSTAELKSFVAEITSKLLGEKVSKEYQHMIGQAGAKWNKDPFIHSTTPLKKRPSTSNRSQAQIKKALAPKYVYSGYIQLGQTKLAIINGMEYAVGETLPDKTHFVKTISPKRVIIGMVNGKGTFQVSITEADGES